MGLYLVRLEIHIGLEDNELFLQAFLIEAKEMISLEMILKGIVVKIVLLLTVGRAAVADVAALVSVSAMGI